MKILDVEYKRGNQKENITITDSGLELLKKDFYFKGYEILSITERIQEKKPYYKNELRKRKFYSSQYSSERRRVERGAISKEEYEKRIGLLKKLIKECRTTSEYKAKYKKEV